MNRLTFHLVFCRHSSPIKLHSFMTASPAWLADWQNSAKSLSGGQEGVSRDTNVGRPWPHGVQQADDQGPHVDLRPVQLSLRLELLSSDDETDILGTFETDSCKNRSPTRLSEQPSHVCMTATSCQRFLCCYARTLIDWIVLNL